MAKIFSEYDNRGNLSVDCFECKRGKKGDGSCSAGSRIKKAGFGSCFSGELLDSIDKTKLVNYNLNVAN